MKHWRHSAQITTEAGSPLLEGQTLFSTNPSSTVSSDPPVPNPSSSSSSYVPQQISSWLGRQKLSGRLKKHFSSSQSNLAGPMAIEPFAGGENSQQIKNGLAEPVSNFSKSYNDPSMKSNPSIGLLKRYQKGKALKRSMGDLTVIGKSQPQLATTPSLDPAETEVKVRDPLEMFGPPPPLPSAEPPPLNAELVGAFSCHSAWVRENDGTSSTAQGNDCGQQIRHHPQSVAFASSTDDGTSDGGQPRRSASSSSTSSDEEDACLATQRSKIRQLQIRPLNDAQHPQLNASVDELRTAIGQIALPKSKGSENDPWGCNPTQTATVKSAFGCFSNSHQNEPIRAALTGDDNLRRKYQELPLSDFSQSVASLSGGSIARARPRSHTPLVSNPFVAPAASAPFVGIEPKQVDQSQMLLSTMSSTQKGASYSNLGLDNAQNN